jgi:hypothetical protein
MSLMAKALRQSPLIAHYLGVLKLLALSRPVRVMIRWFLTTRG